MDKITSSLSQATIRFRNQLSGIDEQDVYNFVRDDLRLTVNGSTNRLPGSQATLSTTGGTRTLASLTTGGTSAPTASPGAYTLSLVDQGGVIADLAGNTLVGSPTPETWNQSITLYVPRHRYWCAGNGVLWKQLCNVNNWDKGNGGKRDA